MKGFFKPVNPQKYDGNHTKIVWRSQWELKYMMQLDHDPNVLKWSSEEVRIPYHSRADNRLHTYFPDFLVHYLDGRTVLYEIKPLKETTPPKPNKNRKRFIKEALTYTKNICKWESAKRWCESRQYTFKLLTERELNIPGY